MVIEYKILKYQKLKMILSIPSLHKTLLNNSFFLMLTFINKFNSIKIKDRVLRFTHNQFR